MINRDFSKSNKAYFAKTKLPLIIVGAFLIVGLLVAAIFGMNGNFEFKGYNEFSVRINVEQQEELNKHKKAIVNIVNSEGGKVDTVSISGEGDNKKVIIRYMNDISVDLQLEIENSIVEQIGVSAEDVSDHVDVEPTVQAKDYVYAIAAILLIIVVATIFAYFRYNAASALAIIISCLLGSWAFMSIGSILRLSIGMSYFAMIAALNMLIVYIAVHMFEIIREESWMATKDYSSAITSAINKTKFRSLFVAVAVFALGLLLTVIAPNAIKYVSLNILFLAVTLLAVVWYVIPFVWSVFITKSRYKLPKKKEEKKQIEEN